MCREYEVLVASISTALLWGCRTEGEELPAQVEPGNTGRESATESISANGDASPGMEAKPRRKWCSTNESCAHFVLIW